MIPAVEHLRGFPTMCLYGIILAEHRLTGKAIVYRCYDVLAGYEHVLQMVENSGRVDIEELTKLNSLWSLSYITFEKESDLLTEYNLLLEDYGDNLIGKRPKREAAICMVHNKDNGKYLVGYTANPTRFKRTVEKAIRRGYPHRSKLMQSMSRDNWVFDFSYFDNEADAITVYTDWIDGLKGDSDCIHSTDITALGAVTRVRDSLWVTIDGFTYPNKTVASKHLNLSVKEITDRLNSTDPVWESWFYTTKK